MKEHDLEIMALLGIDPKEAPHMNIIFHDGKWRFFYDAHLTGDELRIVSDYLSGIVK